VFKHPGCLRAIGAASLSIFLLTLRRNAVVLASELLKCLPESLLCNFLASIGINPCCFDIQDAHVTSRIAFEQFPCCICRETLLLKHLNCFCDIRLAVLPSWLSSQLPSMAGCHLRSLRNKNRDRSSALLLLERNGGLDLPRFEFCGVMHMSRIVFREPAVKVLGQTRVVALGIDE